MQRSKELAQAQMNGKHAQDATIDSDPRLSKKDAFVIAPEDAILCRASGPSFLRCGVLPSAAKRT
jgi:hypothetical protein